MNRQEAEYHKLILKTQVKRIRMSCKHVQRYRHTPRPNLKMLHLKKKKGLIRTIQKQYPVYMARIKCFVHLNVVNSHVSNCQANLKRTF